MHPTSLLWVTQARDPNWKSRGLTVLAWGVSIWELTTMRTMREIICKRQGKQEQGWGIMWQGSQFTKSILQCVFFTFFRSRWLWLGSAIWLVTNQIFKKLVEAPNSTSPHSSSVGVDEWSRTVACKVSCMEQTELRNSSLVHLLQSMLLLQQGAKLKFCLFYFLSKRHNWNCEAFV